MADALRVADETPAKRLEALLETLERALGDLPREALPDFFAALERLRRLAELRLYVPSTTFQSDVQQLLDAKDTAELLGVDPATVYRMAKGPLRSAAVAIGEGTLRFDPTRLRRFIESRRRG